MAQYRKKPVVVEAYRYNQLKDNYRPDWFSDAVSVNKITTHPDCAWIHTLEGTMRANLGDWIVMGVAGEFYPVRPDIFEATYDPASSSSEAAALPKPIEKMG